MHLTMRSVLDHPSLAPARPRVVAGESGLDRRVRWIHSSEVLEIAPLLQGGELLLTGGHVLAGVDPAAQERYVRELAERRVAGVAIETGSVLPAIPEAALRVANHAGFPVIELRAVVPFVSVAEAVNAELVNDSVTRLRFGGELAHALSVILGQGEGVQPLLEELAGRTGNAVAILDAGGETLAEADPPGAAERTRDDEKSALGAVTTRVAVRGVHLATLVIRPGPEADLELLAVAGDRAAEALGLALLRTSSPSPRDIAASELARSAHRPELSRRLARLGAAAGFRSDGAVLGLVVEGWRQGRPGLPGLEPLLHRHGTLALDLGGSDVRVVLSLPDRRHAEHARRHLVSDLEDWAGQQREVVVSVGPVVAGLSDLPTSMRAAVSAIGGAGPFGPGIVHDAAVTMLTDWLQSDGTRDAAREFVHSQLGMVLDLDSAESSAVLETLEAYLDSGCHKTRAADALHVRRQSLYARLDKAFSVLGGDPTGTPRALPLHLALKLRHGLQTLAGSGRG
jgi:PucR family transcriptional regulator, purine catabolism regulatory protein